MGATAGRGWRLRLRSTERAARAAPSTRVGALLGVSKAEAARFLAQLPQLYPRPLEAPEVAPLVEQLRRAGVVAEPFEAPVAASRCASHASFVAEGPCESCGAALCAVCKAQGPRALCGTCRRRERRRARAQAVRVTVLLLLGSASILLVLTGQRRRQERAAWERTLQVAVVLVAPDGRPEPAVASMRQGLTGLESQLATEFARYREGPVPFHFQLWGPVRLAAPPPNPPRALGRLERAEAGLRTWLFLRRLGEQLGWSARPDVTLVVQVVPEGVQTVEGVGEVGGDYGLVQTPSGELASALSLTALAHELLHCLGATDKYDAEGHAQEPDGLAEPDLRPRYPQRFTEVMVGERATGPRRGQVPGTVTELRVGPRTAAEVKWSTSP